MGKGNKFWGRGAKICDCEGLIGRRNRERPQSLGLAVAVSVEDDLVLMSDHHFVLGEKSFASMIAEFSN